MKKRTSKSTFKSIQFPSKDDLSITADLYEATPSRDFILLCHRSHSNRAEYREIAPKLNQLGFSALAIDQRSGMNVLDVENGTSSLAKEKGLPTEQLDAIPDIESAVEYTYQLNSNEPIIIFGSSYSASISLFVALYSEKIKAVIAFSPGEFLNGIDLPSKLQYLEKPVFVTCAHKEIQQVSEFMKSVPGKYLTFFKPEEAGFHGSKTLQSSIPGSETAWKALQIFLNRVP